jgi:hypothetical protein
MAAKTTSTKPSGLLQTSVDRVVTRWENATLHAVDGYEKATRVAKPDALAKLGSEQARWARHRTQASASAARTLVS